MKHRNNSILHCLSLGSPRRGTELVREKVFLEAATRVFVAGGASSSIKKVAREAGVSTRTIYIRFKNKHELLSAVISNLVDQDLTTISVAQLNRLRVKNALMIIGNTITARIMSRTESALLHLLVTEGRRFPKLALRIRERSKERIDNPVEQYFRSQVKKGNLILPDPAKAASLFVQMINGDLQDRIIFGTEVGSLEIEACEHVKFAVEFFLFSATPVAAVSLQRKRL